MHATAMGARMVPVRGSQIEALICRGVPTPAARDRRARRDLAWNDVDPDGGNVGRWAIDDDGPGLGEVQTRCKVCTLHCSPWHEGVGGFLGAGSSFTCAHWTSRDQRVITDGNSCCFTLRLNRLTTIRPDPASPGESRKRAYSERQAVLP